jgi:two-component system torCAD operon response regulator TorR
MDIKIPGKDGLELTKEIRSKSDVGIILVTQKTDDIDKIVGLELGADDYVTKPYNPRELLIRVKNLVHRSKLRNADTTNAISNAKYARFENWTLHLGRRLLQCEDVPDIQLTEGEYKLLTTLIQNAGIVLSRDQIMNRMERRDWFPTDRTIDVLIARIRKKLDDDRLRPRFINTAHGTGYVFVADVTYS